MTTLEEGVDVYTERLYYPVQADSAEEVRRVIRDTPKAGVEPQWQGKTRWRIKWKYTWGESGGVCRIKTATVDVLLHIVLPELATDAAYDVALRDDWLMYRARLEKHEQGHAEYALATAREIKAALLRHEAPSCSGMAESANAVADDLMQRLKATNEEYDARTDHGKKQGVKLP